MSMQTPFAAEIPEETHRLVEPLLAADSVYRLVGNEIDQIRILLTATIAGLFPVGKRLSGGIPATC